MRTRPSLLYAVPMIATLAAGACERQPATVAEVQTATPEQRRLEPVSVVGCLKRGTLTDETYVLLERAPDAVSTDKASTYQLVGGPDDALSNNVGKTVEIAGTLESEQQIASSGGGVAENKAEGTAGTPRVDTTATIEMKKLRVDSLRPLGGDCD